MGTPGWEMAARAALTVICRGATSKLGARSVRREEWSHSPNKRAQPVLRCPNNPDLLCLLLDNKEGGIFISLYVTTAAPTSGRVSHSAQHTWLLTCFSGWEER